MDTTEVLCVQCGEANAMLGTRLCLDCAEALGYLDDECPVHG